jgi:hypothetical protein
MDSSRRPSNRAFQANMRMEGICHILIKKGDSKRLPNSNLLITYVGEEQETGYQFIKLRIEMKSDNKIV